MLRESRPFIPYMKKAVLLMSGVNLGFAAVGQAKIDREPGRGMLGAMPA